MLRMLTAAVALGVGFPGYVFAQVDQTPETALAIAQASGSCPGGVAQAFWQDNVVHVVCAGTFVRATPATLGGTTGAAGGLGAAGAGFAIGLAALVGLVVAGDGGSSTGSTE